MFIISLTSIEINYSQSQSDDNSLLANANDPDLSKSFI